MNLLQWSVSIEVLNGVYFAIRFDLRKVLNVVDAWVSADTEIRKNDRIGIGGDVEASRNMGAMNDLEHIDDDEKWIRARSIVAGSVRSRDRKELVFLRMRDRNWE